MISKSPPETFKYADIDSVHIFITSLPRKEPSTSMYCNRKFTNALNSHFKPKNSKNTIVKKSML